MDENFTERDLEYLQNNGLDEYDILFIRRENAYQLQKNRVKNEFLLTLQSERNKTRACVAAHVQKDRVSVELLTHSGSRKGLGGVRDDDWYFIYGLRSVPIPCEACV